jgi:hypothetical protein
MSLLIPVASSRTRRCRVFIPEAKISGPTTAVTGPTAGVERSAVESLE